MITFPVSVPSVIKLFAKLAQKHNVDLMQFCEDCPEYVVSVIKLLESNDLSVKCGLLKFLSLVSFIV